MGREKEQVVHLATSFLLDLGLHHLWEPTLPTCKHSRLLEPWGTYLQMAVPARQRCR